MGKIFLSVLLTLGLGPGAGHIYLRRYKRGIFFFSATILFAFILAWHVVKAVSATIDLAGTVDTTQLFKDFSSNNPGIMTYYDIIFAAIWAYAVIDVLFLARSMQKPHKESEEPR